MYTYVAYMHHIGSFRMGWDAKNRMDKGKEKLGKDWVNDFCEIPNVLVSRDLSSRP